MQKWIATGMMALTGLLFFGAFVFQDIRLHPELGTNELPLGLIFRYAVAMTLGGAIAGFLLRGLFGRGGIGGWLLVIIGGLVACLISGLFGSAVGLLPDLLADGYHTADLVKAGLGIFVVPLSIIEQPVLLPVLIVLIVMTHILCKRARNTSST